MNKVHAPHPTQHAACGASYKVHVVNEQAFRTQTSEHSKCKRCVRVLAALDDGRPVYSGYEDPETGDRGARRIRK